MAPTELVVRILNDEVETKRMPRTQTTQPQMDCYVMELQVTWPVTRRGVGPSQRPRRMPPSTPHIWLTWGRKCTQKARAYIRISIPLVVCLLQLGLEEGWFPMEASLIQEYHLVIRVRRDNKNGRQWLTHVKFHTLPQTGPTNIVNPLVKATSKTVPCRLNNSNINTSYYNNSSSNSTREMVSRIITDPPFHPQLRPPTMGVSPPPSTHSIQTNWPKQIHSQVSSRNR